MCLFKKRKRMEFFQSKKNEIELLVPSPIKPLRNLQNNIILKNKKSVGWDNIPTSLVKASAHVISRPISFLKNQSFEAGIFPDNLKYSVIKPIFLKRVLRKN